ncbi:MAG: AmmeMemoRadiSam system protein B [Rhodospirillaceae bacterium]|jgi:MEMO1 family protein|nr:AmmeMemoRadiSam system protein B [Rhodospirillaceae bacterium]MBT5374092.1 AmmeMemoRadiSam system protein B [Rhodospirillaceae bacterium]MBT5658593.1 AmmeMemoRadiSam system protein B [Rhodospirillaceae bacterium]MBT5752816.1 AmmeMemoRadiSam system protein B [Rhodospirillaceae bacterium]
MSDNTPQVRPAAVAGSFYPGDSAQLAATVRGYLDAIPEADLGPAPKAIIVPHAGYIYSGPVAATAYARLRRKAGEITRVVLIGPAHTLLLDGMAVPSATGFATPLGVVPVDRAAISEILSLPGVELNDEAHIREHALEVHLPFLMECLGQFSLVPILVGGARPTDVAKVLDCLWGGPETLIVVSSDLSHYHDYETATKMDTATTQAIEALEGSALKQDQACGSVPIRGLLDLARQKGMSAHVIDQRNSGDTAGPHDEVVGYGAYVLD